MSGDVQPRKRKDKRRKKGTLEAKRSEEYLEESAVFRRQSSAVSHTDEEEHHHSGPDEIIHVQKDNILGGNVCAKIVFFCLLGALGVMVGLIITEYRGSNEVDIQSAVDSPWSLWLEGWIDDGPAHHETEVDTGEIQDEHHDDDDDDSEEDLGSKEEEDDDDVDSNEVNDENESDEETADESNEVDLSKEDEEENEDEDDEIDNASEEEQDDVDDGSEEEQDEIDNDSREEQEVSEEENDEDDDNDISQEDDEKQFNISKESEEDDIDESEEDEFVDHEKETEDKDEETESDENEEIEENIKSKEKILNNINRIKINKSIKDAATQFKSNSWLINKIRDDVSSERDDDDDVNINVPEVSSDEMKEDVAKISEILRKTSKKASFKLPDLADEEEMDEPAIENPVKIKEEEEEEKENKVEEDTIEQEEDETSGVALKFGVGVALVVVAHVVLVQKWNAVGEQEQNETEEGEIIPEISRRQTLVPPTEEVPHTTPPDEEYDYSEGDEEGEEDEEGDEEELVQKTYEDLKAKYQQQTPEGSDNEPTEEDFAAKGSEMDDYSPTPPESEGEEGPTESDIEDEEEEDDPMAEWKNRGPDLLAEEVEETQTGSESEDEPPPLAPAVPLRRGGPRGSGEQAYVYADMTNAADWEIREDLDFADEDLNNGKPDVALSKFTALLARFPQSPRALYGRARAVDRLAEVKRSNLLLNEAIDTYKKTLELPDVPDRLFHLIANRTVDRMRFRGRHMDALCYRLDDAKVVLKQCLDLWPGDGLIQAYFGLVLKLQGNHNESIPYLQRGVESGVPGTSNSHFYFHLGDALARNGKTDVAMHFYESGASKGLFRSKYQRSLYNVDHLKSQPWWTVEETAYTDFFRKLENNWKVIRDEGLAALKAQKGFQDEAESLRDTGNWKQFEIFARGQKNHVNCKRTPVTCRIIDEFQPASGCKRGQSKFSVMEGGTHVWSHCGPTNCRLRAHLGLVVPNGTAIRVADSIRNWSEGKILIFDDSFEHEVWHNGSENRLVLIVDVWHPELTAEERSTLSAI